MRAKHCYTCGTALIPKTPPRFDTQTGEKIDEICPSGMCGHFGVEHSFVGGGFFRSGRCAKCGMIEPCYDY